MADYLYRGINVQQYQSLIRTCTLQPQGHEFALVIYHDGTFKHDGSFTFGKSQQNAVAAHQTNSNIHKTSGISTTPHLHRAIYYALNGYQNSIGYILSFNRYKLIENKIELFIVKDYVPNPTIAENDEVIIRAKNDSAINLSIIESIKRITLESTTDLSISS